MVMANPYMSDCLVMDPVLSCSGAIHRNVPMPVWELFRMVVLYVLIFASPKSDKQAFPYSSTRMLLYMKNIRSSEAY